MNGTVGGVVSTAPKTAPKPAQKPQNKPPFLHANSDGVLLTKPSNTPAILSPKPPPSVSPKPKLGQVPPSPKPKVPPPLVSPRPRSYSKPQLHEPSTLEGGVAESTSLANGTPPPATVPKLTRPKPKPPAPKRKSFVPPPLPPSEEANNSDPEQSAIIAQVNSLGKESLGDSSEAITSQGGDCKENTLTVKSQSNHEVDVTVELENSKQRADDEKTLSQSQLGVPSAEQPPEDTSNSHINCNISRKEIKEDNSSLCLSPNNTDQDTESDARPSGNVIDKVQVTGESDIQESLESSRVTADATLNTSTEGVDTKQEPQTAEEDRGSGVTVATAESSPVSLSQTDDICEPENLEAPPKPAPRNSASISPALLSQTDDISEQEKLEAPPKPAPRNSVSSITSVNSSIDSYDLINAGSSFKSHRSASSIHSQASSRRDSDSDEECGVFEINSAIEEEDEEAKSDSSIEEGGSVEGESDSVTLVASDTIEHTQRADPIDEESGSVTLVASETVEHTQRADPIEEESHKEEEPNVKLSAEKRANQDIVSDDGDDVLLVSPKVDEEELQQKELDDILQDIDNLAVPESFDDNLETAEDLSVSDSKDFNADSKTNDAVVISDGEDKTVPCPTSVYSTVSSKSGNFQDSTELNDLGEQEPIPEKESDKKEEEIRKENNKKETQRRGEVEEDEEEEEEETEEETSEEYNEEEEEVDEMGKRVFSLSRKKKPEVLKYSSGEFQEEYTGKGKDKAKADSSKKKQKKKSKKGKKDEEQRVSTLSNFKPDLTENCDDALEAPSDEDRPSKPPRVCPDPVDEDLEQERTGAHSEPSTSKQADEKQSRLAPSRPSPIPAPRTSLSRPVPSPRSSHRVATDSECEDFHGFSSTTQTSDYSQDEGDQTASAGDDVFTGGAGAVVTRLDTDGEEEVIIGGGMPSSSTQTAFADRASIDSSSVEASMADETTEGIHLHHGGEDDRPFRHYATIEPVGGTQQDIQAIPTSSEAGASAVSPLPISATTSLSENQSITISITGSEEPLSDGTEFLSHGSEPAVSKPWSEVAAVTIAVSTMPEPQVPEFTQVADDSTSTTSSASSLVVGKATEPHSEMSEHSIGITSAGSDGQLHDELDDDDEERVPGTLYNQIEINTESYENKDWKYIESKEEMAALVEPAPDDEDEARDTASELSVSSTTTTKSEAVFRSSFGVQPHRIRRRRGSEDYVRLSRISRERTIKLHRMDGTYGLRIQKSKPVVVTNLDKGGPAEAAGLKVGDMLLTVNGVDVRQARHSEVVKLATEAPAPLVLVVGTVVCNSLNIPSDKIVMSGYMHKLPSTGVLKQWRKRWFVLKHDNCLYYYKNETDVVPQGAIVLQNYSVTKARDSGRQYCFKLTKEGAKTFFFSTADDEEMSSWAKVINEAANPNRKSDIWMDISTHNVHLPALSVSDPECQGYLGKFNEKMRNPRRSYCMLKDACLYYYKEMSAMSAQGVVHLHGYMIQEMELKGKKFGFVLKPPESELCEFYFFADHEMDRKRWVSALANSIGRWIQTNATDDGDDDGTEMLI